MNFESKISYLYIQIIFYFNLALMVENKNFQVTKIWSSKEVSEGDGAIVRRAIGVGENVSMDPFLMMDHFNVRLPGGFPDHPHRGFETVTYMFEGKVFHEDFKGHKGEIGPGDVQWMTAGKGIVHSEMPGSFKESSIGIQLWINLNKENKMTEPNYQEISSKDIPKVFLENQKSWVKIISGSFNGEDGPVKSVTSVHYYDVFLFGKDEINIDVISGEVNCFIYVYEGEVIVLDKKIKKFYSGKIEKLSTDSMSLKISSNSDSAFIITLGRPLKEKVVQYGPFVMNTKEELENAIYDYQNGINGFEGAHEWESKIKNKKYEK